MSAEKAGSRFNLYFAATNTVRTRWCASGNGDGARLPGESDTAYQARAETVPRSKFLREYQPYILYFWEFTDQIGFLKPVLQKMDPALAIDGGKLPSTKEVKEIYKKGQGKDRRGTKRKNGPSEEEVLYDERLLSIVEKTNSGLMAFNK